MVQTRNAGVSTQTMSGIRLTRMPVLGEIGDIHSHPIDEMPAGGDYGSFLTGHHVVKFVVSPRRVFALVRLPNILRFPDSKSARQYIVQMGRTKGKLGIDVDDFMREWMPGLAEEIEKDLNWVVDYDSIKELRAACYEAKRGEKVYKRKA